MDFYFATLGSEWMGKPVWMWAGFVSIILGLLLLDLGVFHRKAHEIGIRESLSLSAFYIALGLAFGGFVYLRMGPQAAADYYTGFLIEKTLSLDNIFVMSLIFAYFAIPRLHQHRVLFWGILGVILLRGVMIGAGAALIQQFHWILYVFSAFLIWTGFKLLFVHGDDFSVENSPIYKFLRGHFRITDRLHGDKFFVKAPHPQTGKLVGYITPLFAALVMIEFADILFAVDSVPAIFAITNDPYIVYTSNVFAILGLRALYFALAAMIHRFEYLKYALALVLIMIGAKVFAADFLGLDKIPSWISLGLTVGILVCGVIYSLVMTARRNGR